MLNSSQTFPLPQKYPTMLRSTTVHTANTETRVSDFVSLIVKTGLIKNRDYINAETHHTQMKLSEIRLKGLRLQPSSAM